MYIRQGVKIEQNSSQFLGSCSCFSVLGNIRHLWNFKYFSQKKGYELWFFNKYNFHSYLLQIKQATIIMVIEAIIKTHFEGRRQATNKPKPKATAFDIFLS